MDKVVHFEIPADNVERAQKFYQTVFGWKVNPMPEMRYTILQTVDVDPKSMMPKEAGAINGGLGERGTIGNGKVKGPVVTVGVDNIEKSIEKAKKNGGEQVTARAAVGDMGFAAYIEDSEGNIIGLWESAKR